MRDQPTRPERLRSSRQRYRAFVQDYKHGRLDDASENGEERKRPDTSTSPSEKAEESGRARRDKRREYVREYLRWLWPHRYAVTTLMLFALVAAGLEMVGPLFMRFMIDHVLLNAKLDAASRLSWLHVTGALFLGVTILSTLIGAIKDYSQRVLNT